MKDSSIPKKVILASKSDPAAQNIKRHLLRLGNFIEIEKGVYTSQKALLIETSPQSVSLPSGTDEVIVASRHASQSGRPSLTVHVPGLPEKSLLPPASPSTVRAALLELRNQVARLNLPHQVSLEATHHEPGDFAVPITFVEIGSEEKEWVNENAGEAVARAILSALDPHPCKFAIGVGGPHYSPLYTRISFESNIGFGHILSKHAPANVELIRLALEKSSSRMIVLDWKGATREQREICLEISENFGIEVVKAGSLLVKKL
ncbi:MAG: D-aminoacyl-tRNA deacylase [Candidatus Hadarchaeales archaeon]